MPFSPLLPFQEAMELTSPSPWTGNTLAFFELAQQFSQWGARSVTFLFFLFLEWIAAPAVLPLGSAFFLVSEADLVISVPSNAGSQTMLLESRAAEEEQAWQL